MPSSACLGIVDFIAFFAALRETKVEADRVTFSLSHKEFNDLCEMLGTADPETDDESDTPSAAGQEQLQKLQQQLQQDLHWQISLPGLADLISYITTLPPESASQTFLTALVPFGTAAPSANSR